MNVVAASSMRSRALLLERISHQCASIELEAARLDRLGGFPDQAFAILRDAGALAAPLPGELGGSGLGTTPEAADDIAELLRLLGHASLAVGRLYEGHLNALKLIAQYGTPVQMKTAAMDAHAGHLFGIWVTDGDDPLQVRRAEASLRLQGGKRFTSGALQVTRALVTARPEAGLDLMLIVPVDEKRRASGTLGGLHGMRAACTGSCDFTGIELNDDAIIGAPGDYLRQPEFSAGAWRGIAVALGGIDFLVSRFCAQLRARDRHTAPFQLGRIGEALIAQKTARMWTGKACQAASSGLLEEGEVVATVGLARLAVEAAGLDVIRIVQRGLGLAAFLESNPIERVMRDLATYLRQPAPDETLAEAASWFCENNLSDR